MNRYAPPPSQSTENPVYQPLASAAQIAQTPSRADGVPAWLEEDLRAYGCKLIQQAGVLLKLCVACFSGDESVCFDCVL